MNNSSSQLRKRCIKENIPISPPHEDNEHEHKHSRTISAILSPQSVARPTSNHRSILASSPMAPSSTSTASERGASSQQYLWSPLDTLTESLNDPLAERITLHDLIETYSVICARLKSNVLAGQDEGQILLATNCIMQRASQLVSVLRRDMMRVLIDPCLSEQGLQAPDGGMNEDEIQYARDLAMVSHNALLLISDVMSFPSLISAFSDEELALLLEGILTILLEPSLPTPHSGRTYSLCLWILQVQTLPAGILLSRKDALVAIVKRAVSRKFKKPKAIGDGLKVMATLLRRYTDDFTTPFRDLLPSVLPFLVEDSLDIRLGAAHALSALAYTKLKLPQEKDDRYLHFSDVVHRFLSAHFLVSESSSSKPTLLTILRSSIKMSNKPTHRGEGPQWAAVVISSLIIIFDFCLYDASKMLKIFMNKLLYEFFRHRRDGVRLLHAPVWKSLVWTFSRMPHHPELSTARSDEENDKRNKAFHVLRQELDGGVAVALAATVLNGSLGVASKDDTSVSGVLDMISKMVEGEKESVREAGLLLLARLVSSIGNSTSTPSPTEPTTILDQEFFNGELLETKPELLTFVVESMHKINTEIVRQLTEEEVTTHWDELLKVWAKIVRLALERSEPNFPDSILHIWQALLLVESQLTQNNGHLTASSEFTQRFANICAEFVAIQVDASSEIHQIHLLRELWRTVKRVFVDACLEEPAMVLLDAIVRRDFRIADRMVYVAWIALCQDVVYPRSASKDQIARADTSGIDMKLWATVARKWAAIEEELCWPSLIAFLESPFPEHLVSDIELSLWGKLFRRAVSASKLSTDESESREEHLRKRFVQQYEDRLSLFPKQLFVVISAVGLPIGPTLPSKMLFLLKKTLCALYPPRSDLLDTALQYISLVEEMIMTVSLEQLVSFLAILHEGLCCWLKDNLKAIPDADYNKTVVSLYCSALDKLAKLEPTEDTLLTLWQFFVFPLFRCPPPGLALRAFEKFWRATYLDREEFHSVYPDDLVASLLAYDKVFCAGLAVGFAQRDESQRTTSSYVPESVCSPQVQKGRQNMLQHLEPVQEMSAAALDTLEQCEDAPNRSPPSHLVATERPISDSPQESLSRHSDRGTHHPQSPVPLSTREWVQSVSEAQPVISASDHTSGRKRTRSVQEQEEHSIAKSFPSQNKRETSSTSSRSSKGRLVMDSVEIPRAGPSKRSHESQLMTPEPSRLSSMGASSPAPMSPQAQEDYGNWEEAVSSSELRQLTRELGAPGASSPSAAEDEIPGHSADILNSLSLRVAKRRKTASDLDLSHDHPKAPPLRRSRTASATLEDLQRVFEAYTDDDVDIPIADLIKASRLVHQFGSALSDQIAKRLSPCDPE